MEEKYGISTKKYMLEELKAKIDTTPNFVITNYKGLESQKIEKLRKELIKTSSRYFVVKNSIAKRAFSDLKIKDVDQFITGAVGIGLVGDTISASKTFVDFIKENPEFKVNCAFIDGKFEGVDRIKHLAALPPKEVLLAMAVAYIKSPITGFVGTLKSLLRNLTYAISEIKKKKEGGK